MPRGTRRIEADGRALALAQRRIADAERLHAETRGRLAEARRRIAEVEAECGRLDRALDTQERIIAYRQCVPLVADAAVDAREAHAEQAVGRLTSMTAKFVVDVVVPVYNAPDDVRALRRERARAHAPRRTGWC